MARSITELSYGYRRDLKAIERNAQEVLKQCAFLRRNTANGADDTLRFLVIHGDVLRLSRASERAYRRFNREHP